MGEGRKKRQRRIHAVINAGQIVAQLVSHQDGEKGQRKGQPGREERRVLQSQSENVLQTIDVEKRQVMA